MITEAEKRGITEEIILRIQQGLVWNHAAQHMRGGPDPVGILMEEGDGTPSAALVNKITVTNGDLTKTDEGTVILATGGGGGGAPTTVDYLVGTADGTLSAEIVVGTTPGGELGGTWASPTVDATHSGSSHAGIIATHEAGSDPHPGYRLESADHTHQSTGAQAGQLDHGLALTGLTDDDHTQYLLASAATDRATFAANWTDLTDSGATTLHSHAGTTFDWGKSLAAASGAFLT